jgi:hypothetical protein
VIKSRIDKDKWKKAKEDTQASGGGVLFGCIALSGSGSWGNVKEETDGQDVVLTSESEGVQVIGMVSRVVPVGPNPLKTSEDPNIKWPNGAWVPSN